MQPYFLPHIGYFVLINTVDKFVFLDHAQYIRKGWVNRNRIKIGSDWHYITIPVQKAPVSTPINQIEAVSIEKVIRVLKETIHVNYCHCPHFAEIWDLLFDVFPPYSNISKLNIVLAKRVCEYLKIGTPIYISSQLKYDTSLRRERKIQNICRILSGTHYVNPIGGVDLYSKKDFSEQGLVLSFLKMNDIVYPQGKYDFIPNLSIVDVLMWNSSADVRKMLSQYELV
jgi:hypothetical protein